MGNGNVLYWFVMKKLLSCVKFGNEERQNFVVRVQKYSKKLSV